MTRVPLVKNCLDVRVRVVEQHCCVYCILCVLHHAFSSIAFRAMGSFLLVLREIATATPPWTADPMRSASARLTFSAGFGAAAALVVSRDVRAIDALREPLPRFETGNPCRKDGVGDVAARFGCWVATAMPRKAPRPDRTCGGLY